MSTFAVVTPSRGLVHSRTVEAVMTAIAEAVAVGHEFCGWSLTHDLPIPDCHEKVAEVGLATGAEALWFVEEDVIPPAGALCSLLERPEPISIVDYPVGEEPTVNCAYHFAGEIHWCGLGCTLIRREVFDQLPRPWFRSDITFTLKGGQIADLWLDRPKPYGGQDIYFCWTARQAGIAIGEVPGLLCDHARLRELGASHVNAGQHRIELLTAANVEHWV